MQGRKEGIRTEKGIKKTGGNIRRNFNKNLNKKNKKAGRRNKKGKGWKEEEIKKRTERKKEFRGKGGKKKQNKRNHKSSAGFKLVRLVLLVFLSVEREGVVVRMGFTLLPA